MHDVAELASHSTRLSEAAHLVNAQYPLGLAILASEGDPPRSSGSLSDSIKEWTRLTMKIPPMSLKRLSRLF